MILRLLALLPVFVCLFVWAVHFLFLSGNVTPWKSSLRQFPSRDVSPPGSVILLCCKELALIMTRCLTPSGLRRKAPHCSFPAPISA